jgi:predicted metal-dependent phosphoesterase TrpH
MMRPAVGTPSSPIDLHCHSDRSDGSLAPRALVDRAAERGVRVLGLTDHDTLDGVDEAQAAAKRHGTSLIPGVEISVSWSGRTLHVLGLDVDPASTALQEGLRSIRQGRLQRAELIGQRLAAAGIAGCLRGAFEHARNPELIGRTHFARHLIAAGVASDVKTAFRRFLAEGKPGYVRHRWASLQDALHWIGAAGGVGVLAHPLRYGLRAARLRALLQEFRSLGGGAIEVVTAGVQTDQALQLGRLAAESGLLASSGSDFHGADGWAELGALPALPALCEPVWQHWAPSEGAQRSASVLRRPLQ